MLPDRQPRPIVFAVEHSTRTIFTSAVGIVSLADILGHIQSKVAAGVIDFSELFDATNLRLDLSIGELTIIASEMRRALAGKTPGRVAVVVKSGFLYGLARSYGELTRSDNPAFEVFNDVDSDFSWIRGNKGIHYA